MTTEDDGQERLRLMLGREYQAIQPQEILLAPKSMLLEGTLCAPGGQPSGQRS